MKKSFIRKPISVLLSVLMLLTAWVFVAPAVQAQEYSVGDHIQFGTYPQTKVTDTDLIDELNAVEKTWASYRYYSGNGSQLNGGMSPGDWMRFADLSYCGEKYRAVIFDKWRPQDTGFRADDVNHCFQKKNGYDRNTVYYFHYDPLIWRVLDPSTGFVLSEYAIDAQPYQSFVGRSGVNESGKYANDYVTSSIRAWLNEDFYQTAFSDEQKENIKVSTLDNSACKPNNSRYDSASTDDKVFLLSYSEVSVTSYGFTSNATRQTTGTEYAQCQGNEVKYNQSEWFLRSPGSSEHLSGMIYYAGSPYDNAYVTYTPMGIRPACKLNNLSADDSFAASLYLHTKEEHSVDENMVVENNVDPTCTAAGSYDKVFYCSCGAEAFRKK